MFPISRDPPEGGTGSSKFNNLVPVASKFPISRDPPEGGTIQESELRDLSVWGFQFLGIPPKGELYVKYHRD